MKIINFKTHEEWLRWRMTGIGASEAAAVMGLSPFMTREELWELKTGRGTPKYVTAAMQRGLDLEPVARREYEKLTGIKMPECYAEHSKYSFILASMDGLNLSSEKALEIKCPGKTDHAVALGGKIPAHYVWQCVQILLVTGLPQIDYFSFDGEKGAKPITFRKSFTLEAALLKELFKFRELVINDIRPTIEPIKLSFQERLRKLGVRK